MKCALSPSEEHGVPLQNCGAIPELRHAFQYLWNNDKQKPETEETFKRRRGKGEIKGLISDFSNSLSYRTFLASILRTRLQVDIWSALSHWFCR